MPNANDGVIIQVRALLHEQKIELWSMPYYYETVGPVEAELDRLAQDFSNSLKISVSNCKLALTELQDGALRKLAARKEFEETGVATFNVKCVNNVRRTGSTFYIKCALSVGGDVLQKKIADELDIEDMNCIKVISAGKIIDPSKSLESQGVRNNRQLMAIVSPSDDSSNEEAMYRRVKKIKEDVESIVNADNNLFEMEDQDGNVVHLPPDENRAILMAMGFCEKARVAMKRNNYDEALILLLEADERFSSCNSKFLEAVDNYALVNLDIVWCYLCLKNLTQLPDAQRRLDICERNFQRSYGKNLERLFTLRGDTCAERALVMRLHLLQGVMLFHQNRRNDAFRKFDLAKSELRDLKVDEAAVEQLVEMGFDSAESRIGLRACRGNVNHAVTFIQERKEKVAAARKKSRKEKALSVNARTNKSNSSDGNESWVNPRSVYTLTEMGFPKDLAVVALRKSKNDIPAALDMLQSDDDALIQEVPMTTNATTDEAFLTELKNFGFDEETVKLAWATANNNPDKAIDFLLEMLDNNEQLKEKVEKLTESTQASTSRGAVSGSTFVGQFLDKAKKEMESYKAFERFNEDVSTNENEYLDLSLQREEQIISEYMGMLEQ